MRRRKEGKIERENKKINGKLNCVEKERHDRNIYPHLLS